MGVGGDSFQALEHFVAGNRQAARVAVALRKERAPDGVGVKDAASGSAAGDGEMQECFGGRFVFSAKDAGIGVDFKKIVASESRFIQARGSDQECQRIALENTTVVAAGAEGPAPKVKFAADVSELRREAASVWCRVGRRGVYCRAGGRSFHADEYAMR